MKPVSGNWCWISQNRPDLRYGLAHGWRILIILSTICIYLYIYQYLSRHFRSLITPAFISQRRRQFTNESRKYTSKSTTNRSNDRQLLPQFRNYDATYSVSVGGPTPWQHTVGSSKMTVPSESLGISPNRICPRCQIAIAQSELITTSTSSTSTTKRGQANLSGQRTDTSVETAIKRMLLLNGYPIMYIILWIPGLTNRVLEASGKPSSSQVLAALQCSTQFVGFANAITYGLNRELRQILKRDLRELYGSSKERIGSGD